MNPVELEAWQTETKAYIPVVHGGCGVVERREQSCRRQWEECSESGGGGGGVALGRGTTARGVEGSAGVNTPRSLSPVTTHPAPPLQQLTHNQLISPVNVITYNLP